jgi:hypothetical protein
LLTNAGYIKVAGGHGGSGALPSNTGIFTNGGTLLLAISVGGSDDSPAAPMRHWSIAGC